MEKIKNNVGKSIKIDSYAFVIMKYTLTVGLSFVLSMGKFSSEIAPLGVAFACSVKNELLPVTAVGAVLGYFTAFGFSVETLRYIASVIIGIISLYAFRTLFSKKYKLLISPLAVLLSVFLTGITVALSTSVTVKDLGIFTLESIIGAVSSYFFCVIFNLPKEKRYISRLNGIEITALLVFTSEIILSLSDVTIWYFTLSRVAGAVTVLTCAVHGKEKGGALLGICTGLVLSFADGMSFIAGSFALGGLLAGIFGRKSKFLSSLVFVLTNGIMAIPSASWINAVNLMYDICLACIIIMLCPDFITQKLNVYFSTDSDIISVNTQKQVLRMRLMTASDSLMNVSQSVNSVLKIFERRWEPNIRDCVKLVNENVCENCDKYSECMKNKAENADFIKAVSLKAKNYGCYTKDDLPENGCIKPYDVFLAVNNEYNRYKNLTVLHSNLSRTSYIATDQLITLSDYLNRLSERLRQNENYMGDLSSRLTRCLTEDLNLNIITCGVFSNNDKLYVEMYLKLNERDKITQKIQKTASVMLSREMEIPVADTLSDSTVIIRMCEKTNYTVNYGGSQICADNENWCGDSFDCFHDGKGNLIMILSDGMGTGKRAAADSVMTRSLASGLIRSDFGAENVADIINSSMMLRSSEESTATLDIAEINLYTGKITFYKAGADFSYIVKKDRLIKIEKPSMPLGILRNVRFEKIETTVKDGDIVILMSDGVNENSKDFFKNIILNNECENGEKLSGQLAKASFAYDKGKHHDDITVICGIITKNA